MVFGKETTGQLGLSDISAEESAKIPQPLTYFKVILFYLYLELYIRFKECKNCWSSCSE